MTIDVTWLKDKISKRQIIAVIAIVAIVGISLVPLPENATPENTTPEVINAIFWLVIVQICAVVLITSLTLISYTWLALRYGPDKVNGKEKPNEEH